VDTREALSVGAACLLKVLKVFGFFQQIYTIQISEVAKLAFDTEISDWAQINQTEKDETVPENTKKDGKLHIENIKDK
jgi:uncharacterized protein YqhQ